MKYVIILYLTTSIVLNFACTENRNSTNGVKQNEITLTNITDTLKFKTGIRSILQDSKGNYWFGSDQEGVCRYDGKAFTYYTTENGFCGKQVIYIKEDETGLIWFGTSSGLCCFDGSRFSADKGTSTNILSNEQQAAWSINRNDLWFPGKNQNELIRIDKGKIQTIQYPIQVASKGKLVDFGITGFSKSKNGGLWIAHYSGVSYYDGKAFRFTNDSIMHYDGKSKYMHVRSILEDSKGRLWIGNNGIGVQLKEKDSIIHFSEKYNLFKGGIFRVKSPEGTLMHVFAITEDSKGNIWFGDRDTGVWRFDGKVMENFMLDSTLNTQHIWYIYEDKSGNLLFASGGRGVYKFNGNGFDRVF
jgi:ligand-binding sensor domain-containing protein